MDQQTVRLEEEEGNLEIWHRNLTSSIVTAARRGGWLASAPEESSIRRLRYGGARATKFPTKWLHGDPQVLLDLNLPKKDGREVLAEIKNDGQLRRARNGADGW